MLRNKLVICIILLTCNTLAWSKNENDSALVTTLFGEVVYRAHGSAVAPIQSFMKLREGDRMEVKAKAKLQMVYLGSGEVEQWEGPAAFTVGTQRTLVIASGIPTKRKLPASIVKRLIRTPSVMDDIRNRSGVTVTRATALMSANGMAKVKAARKAYKQARQELPPDDILPELNLLMTLHEEGMFWKVDEILKDMQHRVPNDPVLRELVQRLQ